MSNRSKVRKSQASSLDEQRLMASRMRRVLAAADRGEIASIREAGRPHEGWQIELPQHVAIQLLPLDLFVDWGPEGIKVRTLAEFAPNHEPVRYGPARPMTSGIRARLRARFQSRARYDVITNNCETFVTEILDGRPRSRQVHIASAIGAAACLVLIAGALWAD